MYDPLTSSWLAPDPLAHKYTSLSPYAYCAGNPVSFVDPDGMRQWPVNQTYKGQPRRIDDGFMTTTRPNHKGIDINLGGGNHVKIQSTDGTIATYYMHLNTINVNIGDYIAEGTQIGTIGGSGYGKPNQYRAHLHYELIVGSQHVDPILDSNKQFLVDPARLNEPVHLGTIESSIIVAPKKILESNIELIKLVAPVKSTLNIYPR